MGMDDFAQQTAGDIVYVQLPDQGKKLIAGKKFAKMESGKWLGKVYAPVNGELVDVNDKMKRSILQEIEGHLQEKIEEKKKKNKVEKFSPQMVRRILEEFGEPKEIASEYCRQLAEERQSSYTRVPLKKGLMISIIVICIILALLIAGYQYLMISDEQDDDEIDDNTIIPGKGF